MATNANGSRPAVESDGERLLTMIEALAKGARGASEPVVDSALDAIGLLIERSPHHIYKAGETAAKEGVPI